MEYFNLFRIASYLLFLGLLGHTFGGMLGTLKRGPQAGAGADEVFAKMKSVHFKWNGGDSTWFGWWLGNGLGVSALLLPLIVALFTLGGLAPSQLEPFISVAWSSFASLAILSGLGFKYFAPPIGVVFGLIALLTGIATGMATFGG